MGEEEAEDGLTSATLESMLHRKMRAKALHDNQHLQRRRSRIQVRRRAAECSFEGKLQSYTYRQFHSPKGRHASARATKGGCHRGSGDDHLWGDPENFAEHMGGLVPLRTRPRLSDCLGQDGGCP